MNPFDTSGFPPRWLCGDAWSEQPWIGWIHIVSDLVTFAAYFAVPILVMRFVSKRDDIRLPPIFYFFLSIVFFSCGTVHLIEAGIFWWPAYKLSGLLKLLTAVASATGVVVLAKILPAALSLKSGTAYKDAVTERERAEQELQLMVNRLTLATKAARIGVWDYDIIHNILVWDEEMYRVYGVDPEHFSGTYEAWEEGLHPDDKVAEAEKLQKAIRGEIEFDTEFRIIWPSDGSTHYIKAYGTVLRDEFGVAERVIGVNWDSTAGRRHEEELRQATQQAEAALLIKSEFLANMSHEIRTPMNGIMGMTELLSGTPLKRDQREYVGLIDQSSNSLLTIINDILDFSKIEAGKLQLDPHEFDLRDSICDTLQTLSYRAEEKGLELAYRVQPDVPDSLIGDIGRIRQVLVNLVSNALKFTERGEVIVDVRLKSRTRDSVSLHFLVKDTGIGILADKQKTIFESFCQAESSTTRTYGGTGLGLTISQSLVELMKGRIWVESEEGKGSTFHFTMILGLGSVANGRYRIPPETLNGLRVLVVDDNYTNRRILEAMLSSWDMSPCVAASGAEALEMLSASQGGSEPIQLILLDLMMPGMDGVEVARRIQEACQDDVPGILVLTSAGLPIPQEEAKRLGIERVLNKPVKQSDLLDAITRLFGASTRDEPGARVERGTRPEAIRPMKVLLAEDGRVNQMVAIKLLEERGHTVVVANDGQVAVEVYEREPFDAILMDMQMPRLDGYGATAVIRKHEESSGEHIPIIAMTANALKGDREGCLEAGMDDYVAKPVRSKELYRVLEKFAGGAEEPLNEPEDHVTEIAIFDESAFRDTLGSPGLMRQLLDIFEEEADECLEGARQAVDDNDAAALDQASHSLKGLVGNYCAKNSLKAASQLNDFARKGDLTHISDLLSDCEREIGRLQKELIEFSNRLASD